MTLLVYKLIFQELVMLFKDRSMNPASFDDDDDNMDASTKAVIGTLLMINTSSSKLLL